MSLRDKTFWLILSSVAMGFLEAAVVIYLRLLYYPNGFAFPLNVLSPEVGLVEICREAATIIMLLSIGVLVGSSNQQRLAFFMMAFAVWDLAYYFFLKLFLNWPDSLFTWDILFLIPAPWVGPVLSPIIVCFVMLLFAIVILRSNQTNSLSDKKERLTWMFIISGSLLIVFSWMWDYIRFSGRISDLPDRALQSLTTYVPMEFNWWIFLLGITMIIIGIVFYWRRTRLNEIN